MAHFRGRRVPELADQYFWEEYEEEMEDWEAWYHLGYDNGYASGYLKGEKHDIQVSKLEHEIDTLKALLGANVRVMKAEIRKEMEEENAKATS